jgi:hypothetical protein
MKLIPIITLLFLLTFFLPPRVITLERSAITTQTDHILQAVKMVAPKIELIYSRAEVALIKEAHEDCIKAEIV